MKNPARAWIGVWCPDSLLAPLLHFPPQISAWGHFEGVLWMGSHPRGCVGSQEHSQLHMELEADETPGVNSGMNSVPEQNPLSLPGPR